MAFTLRINSKGLFGKAKSIDFDALLKNCALKYGSANEFYIMKEGEKDGETAILYNPKRIGRCIYPLLHLRGETGCRLILPLFGIHRIHKGKGCGEV